jgi:hypothetical protein
MPRGGGLDTARRWRAGPTRPAVDTGRRWGAGPTRPPERTAAGDAAELVALPGADHVAMIDPATQAWHVSGRGGTAVSNGVIGSLLR